MDAHPETVLGKLMRSLARTETAVLCLLLSAMILLACLQILLRSVFSGGLFWAEPLLRYLVLWSGLLGAAMATSRGKHIALDLAGYLVPQPWQPFLRLLTHLFSTLVAACLTYAGLLFLRSEMEYGGEGLFTLPSWIWNSVFPLVFALITIRYVVLCRSAVMELFRPGQGQGREGVQ